MMKNSLQKLLISICMVGVTTTAMSAPLSDESMQNILKTLDLNGIVSQRAIDQNFYHQYALNKVKNFLGLETLTSKEHLDAVAEIEKLYFQFDQQRLQNIKNQTVEDYKKLFQELQTEESVQSQLQFMNSAEGKAIASKQPQRQQMVLKVYQDIPLQISQQKLLLEQLQQVLQNGGN